MDFIQNSWDYLVQNPLETVGVVLTLVGIWLNVRLHIGGWIVSIVGILCYLIIFFRIQLYGDFVLQIYFLLTSIYGYWSWRYGRNQAELPVTTLTHSERWGILLLIALGTGAGGFILSYFNPTLPYPDAFTTTLSLLAQFLLARKKLENWILWIVANAVYVLIYYSKGVFLTSFLYVLLLLLALNGWIEWRKNLLPKS